MILFFNEKSIFNNNAEKGKRKRYKSKIFHAHYKIIAPGKIIIGGKCTTFYQYL